MGGREQLRYAELCVVAERWISGTRQKDERRIAVELRLSRKYLEALLRHDIESLRHCVWERRGRVQSREAAQGVRGRGVGADGDSAASTGRAGKLSCVLSDGEDVNGDGRWSGEFGGSAGSAGHAGRRCCATISGHRGAAHGDDRVGTGGIAGMCCGEYVARGGSPCDPMSFYESERTWTTRWRGSFAGMAVSPSNRATMRLAGGAGRRRRGRART